MKTMKLNLVFALAAVLAAPARRSDLCGEQGFGMGLCSSIEIK